MSDEDFDRLVTGSSIYRRCQAEKASIARHQKRLKLEEHRDVNFETALVDWMLKRRKLWLQKQKPS